MQERTSAPHGRPSWRYARALAAALIAVAALVTAANAVPAPATDTPRLSTGAEQAGE
ncbi:hypothetical protein [Streptomyces sp. NPDC003401]